MNRKPAERQIIKGLVAGGVIRQSENADISNRLSCSDKLTLTEQASLSQDLLERSVE